MPTTSTPKPKRRYVAQWNALKPATRRRYERRLGGEARAYYLTGKDLSVARGHGTTPEHPGRQLPWVKRALAHDIKTFVPDFDQFDRTTQNELSQWYVRGHFTRGQGRLLTHEEIAEKKNWGTWQSGREYRHWSREQEEDRIQWMNFIENNEKQVWKDNDLDLYKNNAYFSTFSNSSRAA